MKSNNIFPDLSRYQSTSLEEQPVLLDGQKVLFDKKVTLMPVALDKQSQKHGQTN